MQLWQTVKHNRKQKINRASKMSHFRITAAPLSGLHLALSCVMSANTECVAQGNYIITRTAGVIMTGVIKLQSNVQ